GLLNMVMFLLVPYIILFIAKELTVDKYAVDKILYNFCQLSSVNCQFILSSSQSVSPKSPPPQSSLTDQSFPKSHFHLQPSVANSNPVCLAAIWSGFSFRGLYL